MQIIKFIVKLHLSNRFKLFNHQNLIFFFSKITKIQNIYTSYGASPLFQYFKNLMLFFAFTKGGKKWYPEAYLGVNFFSSNFIFFDPYKCINFYSAGLPEIALKSCTLTYTISCLKNKREQLALLTKSQVYYTNQLIYILYVEISSLEPKTKIWLLPMLTCLILGGQGLANSYLSGSTRTPLPFPMIAKYQ